MGLSLSEHTFYVLRKINAVTRKSKVVLRPATLVYMYFPILTTKYVYSYLWKFYKKMWNYKCQFKGVVLPLELWAGHLDHQCSIQLGCTCPWKWREEVEHVSLVRQRPLFLPNLLIASTLIIPCLILLLTAHSNQGLTTLGALYFWFSTRSSSVSSWSWEFSSLYHIEHYTHKFLCMS